MTYKIKIVSHNLKFKFLAKTSRDELRTKETNFVLLTNEIGKTGIGEASIISGLSIENQAEFKAKLMELETHPEYVDGFHTRYQNFPAIRFGIETALLDLKSEKRQILFDTEFSKNEAPIPINGLVWMGDFNFMKSQVKEKLKAGFTCIKLKIGALDFKKELQILRDIRQEFSPNEIEIRVDANGAFTPQEAQEKLKKLSAFKLHSIEQPIKQGQPAEMARLCQSTPLPIALDEELIGINSLNEKEQLLKTIKPQYIILKPSLLGGFKASEEWVKIAQSLKIPYWNTSALEANIGLNAISQWTSSLKSSLPQGLGTGGLYENNIPSPLEVENGTILYKQNKLWNLDLIGL